MHHAANRHLVTQVIVTVILFHCICSFLLNLFSYAKQCKMQRSHDQTAPPSVAWVSYRQVLYQIIGSAIAALPFAKVCKQSQSM
jgi:hypothetical protein